MGLYVIKYSHILDVIQSTKPRHRSNNSLVPEGERGRAINYLFSLTTTKQSNKSQQLLLYPFQPRDLFVVICPIRARHNYCLVLICRRATVCVCIPPLRLIAKFHIWKFCNIVTVVDLSFIVPLSCVILLFPLFYQCAALPPKFLLQKLFCSDIRIKHCFDDTITMKVFLTPKY